MIDNRVIGRKYEQHVLQNICNEKEARLIAVYGRRRVGKTYLVKYFFNERFDFFFTGSFETSMKVQLTLFREALSQYSGQSWPATKSWFEAFAQLKEYLLGLKKKKYCGVPWRVALDGYTKVKFFGSFHPFLEYVGFCLWRIKIDYLWFSHFMDAWKDYRR